MTVIRPIESDGFTLKDHGIDERDACPLCGNDVYDQLWWDDSDYLHCDRCGCRYDPLDALKEGQR